MKTTKLNGHRHSAVGFHNQWRRGIPSKDDNSMAELSDTPELLGKLLPLRTLLLVAFIAIVQAATAKTNPFEAGWCTWGAAELFNATAPDPGVNWRGDAGTWLANAKAAGWQTTASKSGVEVGAIMVWSGNLGHVAVVTATQSGGFTVTEMNMGAIDPVRGYPYTVNFGKWTTRAFSTTGSFNRFGAKGNVTLTFAGFILPRHVATDDLNQQAVSDMQARAAMDARFHGMISGTLGLNTNWDADFELRWATFNFTLLRTVPIYHATYKRDAKVRFTIFYDPDRRAWTDWQQAR